MNFEVFLFSLLATIAIGSSLTVVLKRNPVASAFSLVLALFAFAGIYAMLGAHFVAALQILVYTGAIMVLFIFVIMLLNADEPIRDLAETSLSVKFWGLGSVIAFGYILVRTVQAMSGISLPENIGQEPMVTSNFVMLSTKLFSDHVFVFELTSFLLMSAIVSTIALAKRKRSQT